MRPAVARAGRWVCLRAQCRVCMTLKTEKTKESTRFHSLPEVDCAITGAVESRRVSRAGYFFFCSSDLESFKHLWVPFLVSSAILRAPRCPQRRSRSEAQG